MKSRGTRGLRQARPSGGLIAGPSSMAICGASSEEGGGVGEEVVGEGAEERDAGDPFQAAEQDVSGAVMRPSWWHAPRAMLAGGAAH